MRHKLRGRLKPTQRKKRKQPPAEIEAEVLAGIRRAIRRVGKDNFRSLVELAERWPARRAGHPTNWLDDRRLYGIELLWRSREHVNWRPDTAPTSRTAVIRRYVDCCWPSLGGGTTKAAVTYRLYQKLRKSGLGKLPIEELATAHARLAPLRIPRFGRNPLPFNTYDWPLPQSSTASVDQRTWTWSLTLRLRQP
jgi:hypothetical protein